jgi:SAM-dependent methyltransferase
MFLRNLENENMSHQDFEKYAEQKPFNYKVPEKFRENFDRCAANLEKTPASLKILDFGCGDGKHYNFNVQRGYLPENIFGVEVSKKRIERCRNVGWKNSFFVESEKLPFPSDGFDIISMAEVIEHIPASRLDDICSELVRVIKKNGYLIVTTPNYPIKRFYDLAASIFLRSWKRIKDDPTHVNLFSVKKLRYFLGKYFDSVEIVPYKTGFLYEKYKKDFFLHKMLAICSIKK